jgi:hypothetical protein
LKNAIRDTFHVNIGKNCLTKKTSGRKTHVVGETKGATWLPLRTSAQWQTQLKQGAQFFLLCLNFEQRLQSLIDDPS